MSQQLADLQRDNSILKRAVTIQNSRLQVRPRPPPLLYCGQCVLHDSLHVTTFKNPGILENKASFIEGQADMVGIHLEIQALMPLYI